MENKNFNLPSFVKSVHGENALIPLKFANCILSSKKNLYKIISEDGWFIPDYKSRAINSKYLFNTLAGTIFRIKQSEIRRHPIIKLKFAKIDLICIIKDRLGNQEELGYDIEHQPDHDYLYDLCFTLDPTLQCFTGIESDDKMVLIPIK